MVLLLLLIYYSFAIARSFAWLACLNPNIEQMKNNELTNQQVDDDIVDFAMDQFRTHEAEQSNDHEPIGGFWNGRQIRNAFQTAIALASFDEKGKFITPLHLTSKHFDRVAETTRQFDEYMRKAHGGKSDSERAQDAFERAFDLAAARSSGWGPRANGFIPPFRKPQATPGVPQQVSQSNFFSSATDEPPFPRSGRTSPAPPPAQPVTTTPFGASDSRSQSVPPLPPMSQEERDRWLQSYWMNNQQPPIGPNSFGGGM